MSEFRTAPVRDETAARRYSRFLSRNGLAPIRRATDFRSAELQLADVERQIERKRLNLKHAGDAVTRERAERRLAALERREEQLRAIVNPPALNDDPNDYPAPIECRIHECDGLLPDRRTAFRQAGLCDDHLQAATKGDRQ